MDPIRFVFGLHLHQPVGNFDHVFADHVRDVYRPLLDHLASRDFLPAVLHLSGPLLEWLEANDASYLDMLGRLASDGRIEMLLSGFYEPVLASLPRRDRVEQIGWMRDAIRRRFGVEANGLWLTERVWEPELAADLANAGVQYALVDDRHFLVTGFTAEQLHVPYWTESDDRHVALFPIDERLRYLIPFRPPEETAAYLRELRERGHRLAVLADDGEKFGGWPGTREWVYERGWLDRFMGTIGALVANGEVRLSTLADALEHVPSGGIAYLPSASYREMETWSLPPDAALRLTRLEADLGEERASGPDGALLRGSHWRNFLVKYSESNRMHKKMQALSALCRRAGDPPGARRAIARAQCNDAYWHGVFGGLYLPHLREAIWRELAAAEAELRRGDALASEAVDFDGDGHEEIWVHCDTFSAVVSPRRGGAMEELTLFATGINYANALTRRREAYHEEALERQAERHDAAADGAPSIHDIEAGIQLDVRPPVDRDERALLVERMLSGDLTLESYMTGAYETVWNWAPVEFESSLRPAGEAIEIELRAERLVKRLRFDRTGVISAEYEWEPGDAGSVFTTELSLFRPVKIASEPAADEWRFPIETVAKSERGLDRTLQGESVTLRWPGELGRARIRLEPGA